MPLRPFVTVLLAAAFLLAAVLGIEAGSATPVAAGDNDCKVSLSVGLNNTRSGETRSHYTFGVSANSAESCADVAFGLLITEQLPDGSTKTSEIGGEMRVRNQTRIEAVEHETDARNKVTGFEVKLKSCTLCEAP